jgi:hypothetical protein
MKRIVNGVTYNTDTSTALARCTWELEDTTAEGTLYQTRGGAFFVDEEETRLIWNERRQERQTKVTNTFIPMSAEQAQKWMMEGEVEVFRNPFEDPPEATAESEPAATLYMRVAPALKKQVDEFAAESGLSTNSLATRCMERCFGAPSKKDIETAAVAIFQTLENAHGFPLGSVDVQKQELYRVAAHAALTSFRLSHPEPQKLRRI